MLSRAVAKQPIRPVIGIEPTLLGRPQLLLQQLPLCLQQKRLVMAPSVLLSHPQRHPGQQQFS
jgi:hypothetical protein